MDAHTSSQDALLSQGPRPLQLPPPVERRRLRELWGATIEEIADALNAEPETMLAWESGRHRADLADTYAYLRLLNAFREQLPTAYEPDWAALPKPPAPPPAPTRVSSRPTDRAHAKAARRGARWTREEKDYLRTEFTGGIPIPELAVSLGRSERSVRWVLYRFRLIPFPVDDVADPSPQPSKTKAYTVAEKRKVHPNAYAPWTEDDLRCLVQRCAQGTSLAGLAQQFGRGQGAIASRLLKLKAVGPAAEEACEYGGEGTGSDL